ncbi:hypothetical protein COLO4_04362 [Corchorus olitorius]|uniref:DUF7769 domain-containing protein n=1 Tax=Corchorus olitorius TaxID=93759 RepID=A0A1R3KUE2_9ROSI|nr:hypothetical protein COLO4_04362 [Corchorus olitorius]
MASLTITNIENSQNYRKLSLKEKEHILAVLLEHSKDGKLKWGSIKATATSFNTSARTVRKREEIDVNDIAKIPLRRRTNLRSLAQALNMPKATVYRRVKEGLVKPHSNAIKPFLREQNKMNVLAAIREKWPEYGSKTIYIQQDNAKPRIDSNDAEFLEAARREGFDIRLTNQPPNSPDLNVLDLGFFRAIQALQYQEAPNTVVKLVSDVERLEGQGELPTSFSCDQDIVKQALLHLQQQLRLLDRKNV